MVVYQKASQINSTLTRAVESLAGMVHVDVTRDFGYQLRPLTPTNKKNVVEIIDWVGTGLSLINRNYGLNKEMPG